MLGERGRRKGLEGRLGGVESDGLCFLCEDELRFSAKSWGAGERQLGRRFEES